MKWIHSLLVFCAVLLTFNLNAQDFSKYTWEVFDTTNSVLQSNFITDIEVLEDGRCFITSHDSGLYVYEKGNLLKIAPPVGDFTIAFRQLLYHPEGYLLLAGSSDNLYRYHLDSASWDSIPVPGMIMFMECNPKGAVLLGTHPGTSYSLYLLMNEQIIPIENKRLDVMGLGIAPNGDAVVGFRDGCYRYRMLDNGSYDKTGQLISEMSIYDVAFDSNEKMWATSFSSLQLHSFNGEEWIRHRGGPKALHYDWNGEVKYVAYHLTILPDDRIIIGSQTHCGIGVFDGTTWEAWLVPGIDLFCGIYSLAQGTDGSIYGGTPYAGFVVFKPPFGE